MQIKNLGHFLSFLSRWFSFQILCVNFFFYSFSVFRFGVSVTTGRVFTFFSSFFGKIECVFIISIQQSFTPTLKRICIVLRCKKPMNSIWLRRSNGLWCPSGAQVSISAIDTFQRVLSKWKNTITFYCAIRQILFFERRKKQKQTPNFIYKWYWSCDCK